MARVAKKNQLIHVEKLTEEQRKALNIPDKPKAQGLWNVWECGPSAFDWHYDHVEKAYLYEGDVKVITAKQEVSIRAGDFVSFPKGLKCRWEVHQKVRKVYKFE